jgi:hypothetical protein
MKKIALCLSGQARFLNQCYIESMYPNIISQNDVDIFIHTWDIDPNQIGKPFINGGGHVMGNPIHEKLIDELLELYKPIRYVIEPQIYFENGLWVDRCMPGIRSDYLMSMFYSIYKSNQIKSQYELDNNFKYDWVIRSRFDVSLPSGKLDFTDLDNQNLYTPRGVFDPNNGYLDSFAMSSSDIMDIYSDTFNQIHSIINNHEIRICGEYILRHNIDKHNINVIEHGDHKLYR